MLEIMLRTSIAIELVRKLSFDGKCPTRFNVLEP